MTNSNPTIEVQMAKLGAEIHALKEAFEAEKTASKEAIVAAFKAAETATQAALQAQKESAAKSETNAQKQLEMHNGLIRKMDVLVANFPTKESVAKDFAVRDQRLSVLDRAMSRAYGGAAAAVALAGIAVLLSQ